MRLIKLLTVFLKFTTGVVRAPRNRDSSRERVFPLTYWQIERAARGLPFALSLSLIYMYTTYILLFVCMCMYMHTYVNIRI